MVLVLQWMKVGVKDGSKLVDPLEWSKVRHSPQRLNKQKKECVRKPEEHKSSDGHQEKVYVRVLAGEQVSIEIPHSIGGVLWMLRYNCH